MQALRPRALLDVLDEHSVDVHRVDAAFRTDQRREEAREEPRPGADVSHRHAPSQPEGLGDPVTPLVDFPVLALELADDLLHLGAGDPGLLRGAIPAIEKKAGHRQGDRQGHDERGCGGAPPRPLDRAGHGTRTPGPNRVVPQESAQVLRHTRCLLVAIRRRLLDGLQADRLEVERHVAVQSPGGPGVLAENLNHHLLGPPSGEETLERQELVERGAQGVNVGTVIEGSRRGSQLLRRHVERRPQDVTAPGHPGLGEDARQPEVGDGQTAVAHDEQVGGLDVPVDDSPLVGVLESVRHFRDPPGDPGEVALLVGHRRRSSRAVRGRGRRPEASGDESAGGRRLGATGRVRPRLAVRVSWLDQGLPRDVEARHGPQPANHGPQGRALDQLHRVVVDAVLLARGVDRHDARMVELRCGPRLPVKTPDDLVGKRGPAGQDLQGHSSIQGELAGLVDDPHAPPSQLVEDLEVADALGNRHSVRSPGFSGTTRQAEVGGL